MMVSDALRKLARALLEASYNLDLAMREDYGHFAKGLIRLADIWEDIHYRHALGMPHVPINQMGPSETRVPIQGEDGIPKWLRDAFPEGFSLDQ